jgi:phosphate transport system substrate-binding protein
MKKTAIVLILVAGFLNPGCQTKMRKEQTITISGAFALYPLVVRWAEEYGKLHPEVRFNITGGGAGKGLADALAGVVDLGMFSREITQEEKDKGTWWVGLTIDAVLPTASAGNPYLGILKKRGMTRDEFRQVFVEGTLGDWGRLTGKPGESKMEVFTRSDACGAAETFAKYLGGRQEDLRGVGIYGDPGLAEAVSKSKFGMGFNNTIYIYDIKTGRKRPGIEVIPIDTDGSGHISPEEDFYEHFEDVLRAIAQGQYPSPPARELYFVANGKPQKKLTIDFIRWVLTQGQQYVAEAGYVPLKPEIINEYLHQLDPGDAL